jgi:hypothetical protein
MIHTTYSIKPESKQILRLIQSGGTRNHTCMIDECMSLQVIATDQAKPCSSTKLQSATFSVQLSGMMDTIRPTFQVLSFFIPHVMFLQPLDTSPVSACS